MAESEPTNPTFPGVRWIGPHGKPIDVDSPERPPTRTFMEVQDDLIALVDQPEDLIREQALIYERARIIRDAQDAGVLQGIEASVASILSSQVDFVYTADSLMMINIKRLEGNARQRPEYEDRFDGIIEEYRHGIQIAMTLAYNYEIYQMHSMPVDAPLRRVRREESLLNWVDHPELYGRAKESLVDSQRRLAQMNLPANLAGRGSYVEEFYSPIGLRKRFEEAEADCDSPDLVPQNSLFYEGLTPDEKIIWEERVKIAVARARIQNSFTPDKLFPNPEFMNLKQEGLIRIEAMPGVAEASAIYAVFSTRECRNFGGRFSAMIRGIPIVRDGKNQRGGIGSLLDIQTEGELSTFRERFRGYLALRFQLSPDQARAAEQIAYNKNYISGITAYANSEYFQRGGRKNPDFIPTKIINNAMLGLYHPLEKAWYDNAAKPTSRDWPPNVLGNWIVAHLNQIKQRIARGEDTADVIADVIPLPKALYRDALHAVEISEGHSLYEHMKQEGERLLSRSVNAAAKIPWRLMGETPFLSFNLDLGRAIRAWIALESQKIAGEPGTPAQLSSDINKFRKAVGGMIIGIDARSAQTLLFLLYDAEIKKLGLPGLRASSQKFEPNFGIDLGGFNRENIFEDMRRNMPELFKLSGLIAWIPQSLETWI